MDDADLTRELATKVMRWTEPPNHPGWFESSIGALHYLGEIKPGTPLVEIHHIWAPLESIADAWEVRDRLATGGTIDVLSDGIGKERAEFSPWPDCRFAMYAEARADSAPRAICYAALRAVGIEPEGT